jgi:hypothetical protein
MRVGTITGAVLLCAGCTCESSKSTPPAPGPPELPVSVAPPAPPAPPTRGQTSLATRTELAEDVGQQRKAVVAAIAKSSAALARKKPAEAVDALSAAHEHDPTGAALAVETLRATPDDASRQRWALAARAFGHTDGRVLGRVEKVWGKGEARPPELLSPAALPAVKNLLEACRAVEARVKKGEVPLVAPAAGSGLHCEQASSLAVGHEKLARATALRVDSTGESLDQAIGWVALETPSGIVPFGPVAYAISSKTQGAVSDFVIDVQQIDVLPGGAPEVVLRILELFTAVDVALGEVSKLDRTRVLMLTLDRAEPLASRQLILAERAVREALDPTDRSKPPGWPPAADLGKVSEFEMKVEWGRANEIRLSKTSGNATPPAEGSILLFPDD